MVFKPKEIWNIPNIKNEEYRRKQLMWKGYDSDSIDAIISDEIMQDKLILHMDKDKGNRKEFDEKESQAKSKLEPVDFKSHDKSVKDLKRLKVRFPDA